MTASPQDQVAKISAVIRAARKQLGFSQNQMAQRMGVSQSNFSKFERGVLVPRMLECIALANATGIDLASFLQGFVSTGVETCPGGFDLPIHYRTESGGSRVRGSKALLRSFEHFFGQERLEGFLEAKKVDKDYFTFLDHKISFQFCLDVLRHFADNKTAIDALMTHMSGYYANIPLPLQPLPDAPLAEVDTHTLIRAAVKQATLFEDNFAYTIADEKRDSVFLSVSANEHVREYNFLDVEPFFSAFRKRVFPNFSHLATRRIKVIEKEKMSRGVNQCVYQVVTR